MAGVSKYFTVDGRRFSALRDVDMRLNQGELAVLLGRSGSGKTTLLMLAGALDHPDEGSVVLAGQRTTDVNVRQLYDLRCRAVSWMFETAGLLPLLTALENVALALRIQGRSAAEAVQPATDALEAVGLGERLEHRAFELSGGEQHRVALARALVKRPLLLLADEPTGQLDTENAREVAGLLRDAAHSGSAVIVATHDAGLADVADRVIQIEDGRLQ
jgi:putative ABC transport system ATP-binding protein